MQNLKSLTVVAILANLVKTSCFPDIRKAKTPKPPVYQFDKPWKLGLFLEKFLDASFFISQSSKAATRKRPFSDSFPSILRESRFSGDRVDAIRKREPWFEA